MTAYLLIQKRHDAGPVAGAIRAHRGIALAEDLTGPFDAITLAEADSSRPRHIVSVRGVGYRFVP